MMTVAAAIPMSGMFRVPLIRAVPSYRTVPQRAYRQSHAGGSAVLHRSPGSSPDGEGSRLGNLDRGGHQRGHCPVESSQYSTCRSTIPDHDVLYCELHHSGRPCGVRDYVASPPRYPNASPWRGQSMRSILAVAALGIRRSRVRRGTGRYDWLAVRRLRPGARQVLVGRGNHGRQRGRTRDCLEVGAERGAPCAVRHATGSLPDHPCNGRRHPLPLNDVHAGGGARRRDGDGTLDVRSEGLRGRTDRRGPHWLQAQGHRLLERGGRRAHLPQQPRPAVCDRRRDR